MIRFRSSVAKKVNFRRLEREEQRKRLHYLFDKHNPIDSECEDNYDEDNDNEPSMQTQSTASLPHIDYPISPCDKLNYMNDEINNYLPNNRLLNEENETPLFNGSSITLNQAVHKLVSFFNDFNINKRAVIQLLRIIKIFLPKPNRLPTTWKGIMKVLGRVSTSRATFLCSACLQQCQRSRYGTKSCRNERCSVKNRTMKSNDIVELVHLDIRTQVQSILLRNQLLLNRKELYPMTDICYGEFYCNKSNVTTNRITFIVHVDGSPLIKSSKQSMWPCFASIVELPPPIRDYQKNIVLLSLWTSRVKPDPDVFLHETIEELKLLINNGTSIFINGQEYVISFGTQYFISDLPAKALFCKTINFNGYSACTECHSTGEWNAENKVVIYPFTQNNLTSRTHEEYINAAREAKKKSTRKKNISVNGIKGISALLQIFEYPSQIIFDYMHLVCLGHMPSLIKRWCQSIDRSTIRSIDSALDQLCLPHNVNVPFLDSILNASQWKAKNSRLFVLNVGVPIVTLHLPQLLASHFLLYSMAVKMLHAPESIEEINLAEDLMNYYCKTAGLIHDRSIEIYSLHAHIHLAQQVRKHGGLAHTSAFGFESCIRFISKKAHGSKHLGTQISYWIDLQTIMNTHPVNPPTVTTINEIKWLDNRLDPYRTMLDQQIVLNAANLNSCNFYLRLKSLFVIYHTTIYSQPFKCKSYIISYIDSISKLVHYGNIILFMKEGSRLFAFVQKYTLNSTLITDYLDIPSSLHSQANKLFPILRLTSTFVLIPVDSIRHKCVNIPFKDYCCLSEVRIDYEHD
ncbi:unnamed protein product [Rotaria socialis]|uniref:Transposase n=1 Tax=Rotaria socialis TaxID=392032 RepID=A0A818F9B9_9BILA|nr:unnamed protein product [Rotaria socialis]